jgi:hypothetical protein
MIVFSLFFFFFFFASVSATLKNVYAPVPSVTRSKPVHFGAHPKGTHFIYASARNIVIRNINVSRIISLCALA